MPREWRGLIVNSFSIALPDGFVARVSLVTNEGCPHPFTVENLNALIDELQRMRSTVQRLDGGRDGTE